MSAIHSWAPPADRAIQRCEDEKREARLPIIGNKKGGSGIYSKRYLLSGTVIESGLSRNVVADPERAAAGSCKAPTVNKAGVRRVRDQIGAHLLSKDHRRKKE